MPRSTREALESLTKMVERLAETVSGQLQQEALAHVGLGRSALAAADPTAEALAAAARDLRQALTIQEAQVRVRASDIAEPAIAAARTAATEQINNARTAHEADRIRWDDLERELRRQMFNSERRAVTYGNALIDVGELLDAYEKEIGEHFAGSVHAARTTARIATRRLTMPERPEETIRDRARRGTGH